MASLLPEWQELFSHAAAGNPFANPHWILTWIDHFVDPEALFIVVVRRGDELVGLAPFFRKRHRQSIVQLGWSLALAGSGSDAATTELTQVLLAPGHERPALAELVATLERHNGLWDWAELALTDHQGWFEPDWLGRDRAGASWYCAGRPEAWVVCPLPAPGGSLPLKRNVKESIRRAKNRPARDGLEVEISAASGDPEQFRAALDELAGLHAQRASSERGAEHHDALANDRVRAFVLEATSSLAAEGLAEVWRVRLGGTTVAAHLVLRTHDAVFFSLSGQDPEFWDYNAPTLLTAHILEDAISRGCTLANLSRGPRVAKLRWSERLLAQRTFFIVNASRSGTLRFTAYWLLRSILAFRREWRFAAAASARSASAG